MSMFRGLSNKTFLKTMFLLKSLERMINSYSSFIGFLSEIFNIDESKNVSFLQDYKNVSKK